jgi:Kelch motif
MRTSALFALLSFVGTLAAADTAKKPTHAMLPRAVSSLGACVEGADLYIYGGHTGRTHNYSTKTVTGAFLRMPVAGGEWEELTPDSPVQGTALVGYKGKVYRVGGMQPRNAPEEKSDTHSLASVSCYDPARKKWSALPDLPKARSSHDAVVVGDKLYVVGGWTLQGAKPSAWLDTVDILDLKSAKPTWASVKQPFQRRALSAFVLGGKIHVVGGLSAKGTTKKVEVFDPRANTWGEGPELVGTGNVGFSVASCVAGGSAFVSGSDGKVYRLDGKRWTPIATQKVPRFVHRLVPGVAGKLLVVGGAAHEGNARIVEEITIPARR